MVPSDDALTSRRSPVNCRRTARAGEGGLERLGRALLLNASFEPLCVVPMRRAVVLVLKDKAEIIARNGGELHSERAVLPIPSVIRLVPSVRVPFRNRVPLSLRAGLPRDRPRRQYGHHGPPNIDHGRAPYRRAERPRAERREASRGSAGSAVPVRWAVVPAPPGEHTPAGGGAWPRRGRRWGPKG